MRSDLPMLSSSCSQTSDLLLRRFYPEMVIRGNAALVKSLPIANASLGACFVAAHVGCPISAIVGSLCLEMNLIVSGKHVRRPPIGLLSLVGAIARVDPAVADDFQIAPGAGGVAFHAHRLVTVGITAILHGMQWQEDYERRVFAIDDLIAREKLPYLGAMVFEVSRLPGL